MINTLILQVRIPNSDKFKYELKEANGEKKAFLGFMVSVRRAFKPEGAEFYPEDLFPAKAFGGTAEFIFKNFGKGDSMLIEGELRKNDDYEDKEGNTVRGEAYIHINQVHFQYGLAKDENGDKKAAKGGSTKAAPAASRTVVKAPTSKPSVALKKPAGRSVI